MKTYRENEEDYMKEPDWFACRYNDKVDYDFWKRWRWKRSDVSDDLFVDIYTKDGPTLAKAFLEREHEAWHIGLWCCSLTGKYLRFHELADRKLKNCVQVLTGAHYIALNYLKQSDGQGSSYYGDFYRHDQMKFDYLDCLANYELGPEEDRLWFYEDKCRGVRSTTCNAATQFQLFFCADPFKIIHVTDGSDNLKEYGDIVLPAFWAELPLWLRRPKFNKAEALVERFIKVGAGDYTPRQIRMVEFDERVGQEESLDQHLRVTYAYPKACDGPRVKRIYCDERGNWPVSPSAVQSKYKSAMGNSKERNEGLMVFGGTADMANTDHNPTWRKWQKNPIRYNIIRFFSGYQHKGTADEWGWTEEERRMELVKQKLQELEEIQDYLLLAQTRMDMATCADDAYHTSTSTYYSQEEIRAQLKNIDIYIKQMFIPGAGDEPAQPFLLQRGWFRENINDYLNPFWEPHEEGGWQIALYPEFRTKGDVKLVERTPVGMDYVMGTDNVMHEKIKAEKAYEARISKKSYMSRMAGIVRDVRTQERVALYLWRHDDAHKDYLQLLLGALYWNCLMSPESNLEFQTDWQCAFTANNRYRPGFFKKWLMPTPDKYKHSINGLNQFGLPMLASEKGELIQRHIIADLSKNICRIYLPELLNEYDNWDIQNSKRMPDLIAADLQTLRAESHCMEYGGAFSRLKIRQRMYEPQKKTSLASEIIKQQRANHRKLQHVHL